tara:strand:+ start:1614 stop:1901 length:288 start_codon:yes stop_codon:yes gene_type:complete
MSKNTLKYIVIILGLLIILSFFGVIYGMYSKLSTIDNKNFNLQMDFSLELNSGQSIKNIEVLDKNTLLILIQGKKAIKGAIYDINKNEIVRYIEK